MSGFTGVCGTCQKRIYTSRRRAQAVAKQIPGRARARSERRMSCECRCHVNAGAGCDPDHDTGSSGVQDGYSCSPCDGPAPGEKCDVCGSPAGEPHTPVEGDCILPHDYDQADHPPRARVGWCCASHVHRHRYWLAQIDELWETLDRVTALGTVRDNTADHRRTGKAPASPVPFRTLAWALHFGRIRTSVKQSDGSLKPALLGEHLPKIDQRLNRWVAALHASGWQGDRSSNAIFQLRRAAEHIAAQPWVDEYDAEIRWIWRTLRRAHGLPDRDKTLGRCLTIKDGHDCGGTVREVPNGSPRCDTCRRQYEDPHDLMRLKITEDQRRRDRDRDRERSA
jgi:hypothetical protein